MLIMYIALSIVGWALWFAVGVAVVVRRLRRATPAAPRRATSVAATTATAPMVRIVRPPRLPQARPAHAPTRLDVGNGVIGLEHS